MDATERCTLMGLAPDGSMRIRDAAGERDVEIFGIVIPRPPPALYVDIVGKRLPQQRELKCRRRGVAPNGRARLQFFYYAMQDKSGDVWEDLALTLLEQGVARVSDEQFAERDEYLRHAKKPARP